MGASQSQIDSATKIAKEVATDIMKKNSAKCAANTATSQEMNFSDITAGKGCILDFSNISQKADVDVKLDCTQVQQSMTDIQNNFKTAIDEKFKNESQAGLGFADASLKMVTDIKEAIKTKFDLQQLAECITDLKAQQKMNFKGIYTGECNPPAKVSFSNINQTIFANNAAKCVQKQVDAYTQQTNSDTDVKKEGEQSAKGGDLTEMIKWLIIGVVVAIFAAAFVKFVILKPPSIQQPNFPKPQYF